MIRKLVTSGNESFKESIVEAFVDFNCSFFVISDRVVLSDLQRQKHRVTSEDCGELQLHLDNKPSFTGSFDQVPLGQQRDHAI